MRLERVICGRRRRRTGVPVFLAGLACALGVGVPDATAAATLTIEPTTWNVIGLDSNDVNAGPNQFPVGVTICNTGTTAATALATTFVWDSANANIAIAEPATRSHGDLAAGACRAVYYTAVVTRTSVAYDTARRFRIEASAVSATTVSTPTPRELYVERLVSQGRNAVLGLTGPSTVRVGSTVTYTVTTKTATNGYEQLVAATLFPTSMFRVVSTSTTYSAPAGATSTSLYADACGWNPVPGTSRYLDCVGPANYAGGKAGGNPIMTVYTLEVVGAGTAGVQTMVYDFSGSSFHYNLDFGSAVTSITATANTPPVANPDSATTSPGTGVTIPVVGNDTDADGDTLTVTSSTTPANGTVSCGSTSCTYTPTSGFSGIDTFTYTISDGYGGSATATVTITVETVVPAFGVDSPLPVALAVVALAAVLLARRVRRSEAI